MPWDSCQECWQQQKIWLGSSDEIAWMVGVNDMAVYLYPTSTLLPYCACFEQQTNLQYVSTYQTGPRA